MPHSRSNRLAIGAVLGLLGMQTLVGDRAQAVTKLHDPILDHITTVHGATNGHGIHRGPWVAQVAVASGDRITFTVNVTEAPLVVPTLRIISGDGTYYRGSGAVFTDAGHSQVCVVAPVTGWLTVHVDVPGASERRFEFSFARTACE